VSDHQADYPIATMCRVLGVSSSGYHAWVKRCPSQRAETDAVLIAAIRAAHTASRGTYGAPRVHAELAAKGIRVDCKRVARLMTQRVSPVSADASLSSPRSRVVAVSRPTWLNATSRRKRLDRRHHLDPDLGRFALSRGRARRLQPSYCRLVDGHVTRQTTGHRCAEHGAGDATSPGRDPSL
jgi:hypothetical protein